MQGNLKIEWIIKISFLPFSDEWENKEPKKALIFQNCGVTKSKSTLPKLHIGKRNNKTEKL